MSKSKMIVGALCALGFAGSVSQAAPTGNITPQSVNVTPNSVNVTPNSVNVTPNSPIVNPNSVNIAANAYRYGYPYTYTILTPNGYITRTYFLPYPPSYYYRAPAPQYYGRNDGRRYRRNRR